MYFLRLDIPTLNQIMTLSGLLYEEKFDEKPKTCRIDEGERTVLVEGTHSLNLSFDEFGI